MIGIVGYGSYLPRLRLSRTAVVDANAWFAPQFTAKAKGTRAMVDLPRENPALHVRFADTRLRWNDEMALVPGLAQSALMFAARTT